MKKALKAASLALGIAACAALTPFTAPFGVALRGGVAALESKPFIYLEQAPVGKVLPDDRKITMVSHNGCYMPGGYSITDGHATPPSDKARMDANLGRINSLNPDVVCLYEVADICDASYISSQLSDYPFVIPVAGVRAIGPSLMMYIASKYKIVEGSIEFDPFVKGAEVTGDAQYSEKGVLTFDIETGRRECPVSVVSDPFASFECPEHPEESERVSRAAQMDRCIKKIQNKVNRGQKVIFTGDLNADEDELDTYFSQRRIDWLNGMRHSREAHLGRRCVVRRAHEQAAFRAEGVGLHFCLRHCGIHPDSNFRDRLQRRGVPAGGRIRSRPDF